jgi:hypothetical protein
VEVIPATQFTIFSGDTGAYLSWMKSLETGIAILRVITHDQPQDQRSITQKKAWQCGAELHVII